MVEEVKRLRKSLKLTQKEFADKLGVSQPRITEVESKGYLSESLKEKIEQTFKVVLKSDKIESVPNPDWVIELVTRIENDWRRQTEFLQSQLERKDKLIDALTEKFLKDEVANWPPMCPVMGGLGLATEVQLRAA